MDTNQLKKCFISSLYVGDKFKDHDKPGIFDKLEGFDYFLFTNLEKGKLDTSWEIVNYESDCSNSITRSRYPKFQGWKLIKEKLDKEYDVIIYCDAFLKPAMKPEVWEAIVDETVKSKNGLVQTPHSRTKCPYNECDRIVFHKKDTLERINKTKLLLKRNKIPKKCGVWENTCFAYSPKNENAVKLFNEFWDFYKKEEYTYRDQPLFIFFQIKIGIKAQKSKYFLRKLVEHTGEMGFHRYC